MYMHPFKSSGVLKSLQAQLSHEKERREREREKAKRERIGNRCANKKHTQSDSIEQ